MFDTGPVGLEGIGTDGNERPGELFQESMGLNSEVAAWHMNQQEVPSVLPLASFSGGMDSNYLPPLIESNEGMAAMEVQPCSINGEREMGLELNEWVESQQCASFLFWDQAEGPVLGGEEIAPASSNMGTMLSPYPSSL